MYSHVTGKESEMFDVFYAPRPRDFPMTVSFFDQSYSLKLHSSADILPPENLDVLLGKRFEKIVPPVVKILCSGFDKCKTVVILYT